MTMIEKKLVESIAWSSSDNVGDILFFIGKREEKITLELHQTLINQCQIESKVNDVNRVLSIFNDSYNSAVDVNTQISLTTNVAEAVSAKVRCLDMARMRASECQQRVNDLIDLQLCSHGVISALSEENYEKGAKHIKRFLAMDPMLLKRTATDVQSSVSSVSDAVQTLEYATTNLRNLIIRLFDESVHKEDVPSVERYFKIFPMVGYHQEGIEKFANYVNSKLRIKAMKDIANTLEVAKSEKRFHLAYADTFTTLLENVAGIIEINQPIIHSFYGSGYIVNLLRILQRECDAETRNLMQSFNKDRQISHYIQQINENKRAISVTNTAQCLTQYRKTCVGINSKDIDLIITEITLMHSRAELYFRFILRRGQADIDDNSMSKENQLLRTTELEKLIQTSDLKLQMQQLLSTYLSFERYLMEESVRKAIVVDSCDMGQQCSSVLDDIFFILRKSIRRSLTTQSVNGVCAIINTSTSCLGGDYLCALKAALRSGYPSGYIDLAQAYNVIHSSFQQGKLQSNDLEKFPNYFLVQLNNADKSVEYIETLCRSIEHEINGIFSSLCLMERQIIDSCIAELRTMQDEFKSCVDFGLQQLNLSSIKPRLYPWIDEFLKYDHRLTEEELSAYEANETFIQYLIVQIDGLLNPFKNMLSSRNYDSLVSVLATEATMRLERAILKSSFNRLGGLILDQEVRALGAYLSGTTSWSVRDKMTRLTQITTILNLEKISELADYWVSDNGNDISSWHLTESEVKTILALRIDFRMEDIKQLQL